MKKRGEKRIRIFIHSVSMPTCQFFISPEGTPSSSSYTLGCLAGAMCQFVHASPPSRTRPPISNQSSAPTSSSANNNGSKKAKKPKAKPKISPPATNISSSSIDKSKKAKKPEAKPTALPLLDNIESKAVKLSDLPSNDKAKKPKICRMFLSLEGCRFGEKCRYSHDSPIPKTVASSASFSKDAAEIPNIPKAVYAPLAIVEPKVKISTPLLDRTSVARQVFTRPIIKSLETKLAETKDPEDRARLVREIELKALSKKFSLSFSLLDDETLTFTLFPVWLSICNNT